MNRLSWYMEDRLSIIHDKTYGSTKNFDYTKLMSYPDFTPKDVELALMKNLFVKYNSAKKAMRTVNHGSGIQKDIYYIISEIGAEAREKITSNNEELGNLAVSLMIQDSRTRAFAWTVFGTDIVSNMLIQHGGDVEVLVQDSDGDHNFMFDTFSKRRLSI